MNVAPWREVSIAGIDQDPNLGQSWDQFAREFDMLPGKAVNIPQTSP